MLGEAYLKAQMESEKFPDRLTMTVSGIQPGQEVNVIVEVL